MELEDDGAVSYLGKFRYAHYPETVQYRNRISDLKRSAPQGYLTSSVKTGDLGQFVHNCPWPLNNANATRRRLTSLSSRKETQPNHFVFAEICNQFE